MNIHTYIRMKINTYIWIFTYLYMYVYICTYIHIYILRYTYVHIYSQIRASSLIILPTLWACLINMSVFFFFSELILMGVIVAILVVKLLLFRKKSTNLLADRITASMMKKVLKKLTWNLMKIMIIYSILSTSKVLQINEMLGAFKDACTITCLWNFECKFFLAIWELL
jgi:hypothetical protein